MNSGPENGMLVTSHEISSNNKYNSTKLFSFVFVFDCLVCGFFFLHKRNYCGCDGRVSERGVIIVSLVPLMKINVSQ